MAVATVDRPSATPAVPDAADAPPVVDIEERNVAVVGMAVAIVADAMVLAGLLAAYFQLRATSFAWPPKGVSNGRYLPGVVTLTVVMSAFTVQWVASALRRGDRRNCIISLLITIGLGFAVLNAQWYSFGRRGFSVSSHAYGTIYDALIGYHVVNLLVGMVLLAVVLVRTLAGASHQERPGAGAAAAMFWQYNNLAWLVVFVILYLVH
jgi:cytochrome c oxidase subunit 3